MELFRRQYGINYQSSVPEIIKAKSYADRFTEKLYTVKTDVPIVRMGYAFLAMGYVLERIVQRLEETSDVPKADITEDRRFGRRSRQPNLWTLPKVFFGKG